jgi:hypothetical protein
MIEPPSFAAYCSAASERIGNARRFSVVQRAHDETLASNRETSSEWSAMITAWRPYHEPLRTTLVRTILIAMVAGTVFAAWSAHSTLPIRWPVAVVLMLWVSFGGHWLELWYLNWLRPRLPSAPPVQRIARLGTWYLGGCVLGVGMALTGRALGGIRLSDWPAWWVAGVGFIGVELVAHAVLEARGRPSFFTGRG